MPSLRPMTPRLPDRVTDPIDPRRIQKRLLAWPGSFLEEQSTTGHLGTDHPGVPPD